MILAQTYAHWWDTLPDVAFILAAAAVLIALARYL